MSATPSTQPASDLTTTMASPLAASIHPTDDQLPPDTHRGAVVGGDVLRPGHEATVAHTPSVGSDTSVSSNQMESDTQASGVAADVTLTDSSQRTADTHPCSAAIGDPSTGNNQSLDDPQLTGVVAGVSSNQPSAIHSPTPIGSAPDGWLELRLWAEMFDDAQKARIANVNRAERGGADPDVFAAHIAALTKTEHDCRLMLRRTYRRITPDPIKDWQKASVGIGIDMLGRLLGHLGHPVWATPHHWEGTGASRVLITDPPYERTVSQLWQYCGHGAPARRSKGMTATALAAQGNPKLKMLVHLNAEMCMKQRTSPYRLVYETARQDTTDKVHTVECVRCGPSGKPAQPDSPWSPGHQHAHALRITGKEILRDLWTISSPDSQRAPGTHASPAAG